jgi:hypothetical protein
LHRNTTGVRRSGVFTTEVKGMTLRRLLIALAVAANLPAAAHAAKPYQTTNFVVRAPTDELAKTFGEMAEHYRREKAIEWLGREMPPWPQKCPLDVQVVIGSAGGATTFTFGSDGGRGVVTSQKMEIRGEVKQLLHSVLPHEVTHTVLAYHFGRPVPRWADEGGSVLSENDDERFNHDVRCREILNAGRAFRLRTLFQMTDYPRDMIVLYAQGYSVCAYLVEKGGQDGRAKLLQFLAAGMQGNSAQSWNEAARSVFGYNSVDAMEAAWLKSLETPPTRYVARPNGSTVGNPKPAAPQTLASGGGTRNEIRSSAPPALPLLEPPVRAARGTAPDREPVSPARPTSAAPRTAPDYPPVVLGAPELPRPVRP